MEGVSFRISLSGIPMKIYALYESTKEFCRSYFTDEPPCFEITITQEDIETERRYSLKADDAESRPGSSQSAGYLEKLALYRKITLQLINYDVLLMHGAVIVKEGCAYLFTAKSGTGKTTHTQLWVKNILGSYVLNGDKPLLLFKNGKVYACGTPWQGKEHYGTNEIRPLKAICFLQQSPVNKIEKIPFAKGISAISTQIHHPLGNDNLLKSMQLIQKLSTLPIYRLSCNMEDEAAWFAFKGITRAKSKTFS